MARYKILIKKSATKELREIPKRDLQKIVKRILSLTDNPRPKGHQKLSHLEQYRIRQGDYRIIYAIEDEGLAIHIVKIGHRKEIYRS